MNRRFRIIVQRHADGYTEYPLGMRGVADGRGDTHGQALAGVRSAIRFHIETFGDEPVDAGDEVPDVFLGEAEVA